MKRIIMMSAALALLTTTAQADNERLTRGEWVMTLYLYQTQCRSLGISQREFENLFGSATQAENKSARETVTDNFFRDKAGWCQASHALIAANRKWNFQ